VFFEIMNMCKREKNINKKGVWRSKVREKIQIGIQKSDFCSKIIQSGFLFFFSLEVSICFFEKNCSVIY